MRIESLINETQMLPNISQDRVSFRDLTPKQLAMLKSIYHGIYDDTDTSTLPPNKLIVLSQLQELGLVDDYNQITQTGEEMIDILNNVGLPKNKTLDDKTAMAAQDKFEKQLPPIGDEDF